MRPDRAAAPGSGGPADRDIDFLPSAFGTAAAEPSRWTGWRRQALLGVVLAGSLCLLGFIRVLAREPWLEGRWLPGPRGELLLQDSADPALQGLQGRALVAVAAGALPPLAVDGLLLHRWPRWQIDDALRARQWAQHQGLADRLALGRIEMRFDDGRKVEIQVGQRGYSGLGWMFWPLTGLALLLALIAAAVFLARPQRRQLPFVLMSLGQSVNLLYMALENAGGLGLPAAALGGTMALRVALDLATGAAVVSAFAALPTRLPQASRIGAAAWSLLPLWLLLSGPLQRLAVGTGALWWWAQAGCLALGVAAWAVITLSHRRTADPYALVMSRFAAAAVSTLLLSTLTVLLSSTASGSRADVADGVSMAWYLFLASLLLLTPFLARSRRVLREFAMLAGIGTVATTLDLLLVAVFSLGPFTSLAISASIGLGLYGAARQWVMNHLAGSTMLTTERTFDQLYRAAREVRQRPERYREALTRLLRDLFQPLELATVERVPVRARVISGGSALVVPMRSADDESTLQACAGSLPVALVMRYARHGRRLFTLDDARLAERVVDQLRRAVVYDQAVERGRVEERLRIAQDLHDDIGARLLTLMYQAPSREMEDYIRHTLQDLKTLTRGLAAADHRLSHAAAEWKSDLTQRLGAASVALDWQFEPVADLRLSVVQWSALTRVLRELVSNALFHGHASRIGVELRLEGTRLTLRVADDGVGRAPPSWAHGLGMGGIRKRVKLLGGEVRWTENGACGIVCTVEVAQLGERP